MNKESNTSNRLKYLMDYYNLTQAEISKKTGIPKSTLSMYISGEREPKQVRLSAIADAFCVSEVWLMGYDVPMQKSDEENIVDSMVDIMHDNYLTELTRYTKNMKAKTKEHLLRYAKLLLEEQEDD